MEFESSVDKMSDNLLALVSSVVAFQCSVILNSKMFMKIPPIHKILARIYCSLITLELTALLQGLPQIKHRPKS